MFSFQNSLPKLTVPSLAQTLGTYLETVRPFVTDEQLRQTRQNVEEFMGGDGAILQAMIEERTAKMTNWVSDWWRDIFYLSNRKPLAIIANPGLIFPRQSYAGLHGQLRFASLLVAAVLDYKTKIETQTLPVEHLKGEPLCMMQYCKILTGYRIPRKKKDELFCSSDCQTSPTHITVLHNNAIFSVDVYGHNRHALNVDQIYQQLLQVVEESKQKVEPMGLLTMKDRDSWSDLYSKILENKVNKSHIESIKQSLFVLCLDEPINTHSDITPERRMAAKSMLHGGGSCANSGNRWFDKTLQIIVGDNGMCGINYEHSSVDGTPIVLFMEQVLYFCEKYTEPNLAAEGVIHPKKLKFNLPTEVEHAIEDAKLHADTMINAVDVDIFIFKDFGKNFPKTQNLSPDAFIQVALQLACYRLNGELTAGIEPVSLRRFQYGRLDIVRPCSMPCREFIEAMEDNNLPTEHKSGLLKAAVVSHRKYIDEVISGNGFDLHLLRLKLTALETGMKLPNLFSDSAFIASSHFRMCSSQVPTKYESVRCIQPASPDGYGVCYNPQETQMMFGITSFNTCPHTSSQEFTQFLDKSLKDMKSLIVKTCER